MKKWLSDYSFVSILIKITLGVILPIPLFLLNEIVVDYIPYAFRTINDNIIRGPGYVMATIVSGNIAYLIYLKINKKNSTHTVVSIIFSLAIFGIVYGLLTTLYQMTQTFAILFLATSRGYGAKL